MSLKQRQDPAYFPIIICFLLILCLVVFLAFADIRLLIKNRQLGGYLESLERTSQRLEETKKGLEEQIKEMSQDDYWEKILREKGMYKKAGEKIVVVVPDNNATTSQQSASQSKTFSEIISQFYARIVGFVNNLRNK